MADAVDDDDDGRANVAIADLISIFPNSKKSARDIG
jgi:hypothetical protein